MALCCLNKSSSDTGVGALYKYSEFKINDIYGFQLESVILVEHSVRKSALLYDVIDSILE